ncbi:hypothetical protein [Escherichia phage vB_EcoS_ULIM2]|nr:hypothetical protein [Escherichia phage vB_EcoS_ULIM2]
MQNTKDESVKIEIKVTRNGETTRYKKRLNLGEAVIGRIAGVMIKAQEDEAIQS